MFLSYPVIYLIWLRQREIPLTQRRWRPLLAWLGLAFFPWLSSLIPLPPELYRFPITPLNEKNWTLHAPARLVGESIHIKGAVPFGGAYAAESAVYVLPRGLRIGAAGIVRRGGLVLGLLNSNKQWGAIVAVPPGRFRTYVEVPADGAYQIVLANNLSKGAFGNDAEIYEVGLVGSNGELRRGEANP